MNFAFDVDGTIFDWDMEGGFHPTRVGKIMPGAIEVLTWVAERGHGIIIFSCRVNPGVNNCWGYPLANLIFMLQTHLYTNKIPFNDIAVFKPNADWFFDDKANFTSWDEVKKKIIELEENLNEHEHQN